MRKINLLLWKEMFFFFFFLRKRAGGGEAEKSECDRRRNIMCDVNTVMDNLRKDKVVQFIASK